MGKLGDPSFLDPLQRLVKDDSPPVRGAALRAMIGIRRLKAEATGKPVEVSPVAIEKAAQILETKPVIPAIELRLDGRSFAFTRDNIDLRP
jgi:hypothetical protein